MEDLKKKARHAISEGKADITGAANQLLNEGKKLAHELYEDNLKKVGETQDHLKEYSDELTQKVKENPITSLLIAGGIGFLISSLLKK
ncbi:hypothetical protein [uncultured Legionella sp.]|uniref:hypothetical protein n=1 Tax=uncultured Legionella sp. TaxID=210934 RepID=UPI0026294EEB|nr:hypothetical protein [uncultured Legionella sp.]